MRCCIIGAKGTGKTTFFSQAINGKKDTPNAIDQVGYKLFENIGGKLRVRIEFTDMPESFALTTQGFFSNKAFLFILFDLSRPSTFFDDTGKEKHHVKYLINEAQTLNRNPNLKIFLIGTNADKSTTFDRMDAERFAEQYKMDYHQVNCLNTKDVQDVMKEAISLICRNIDSEHYQWDEKKGWDKYGIKVVGDRKIIDNPPKEQPQDNNAPSRGRGCLVM